MKQVIYRFLRFSEKYLKTDMVYIAKGSFWMTIGQGIAVLSSLFLSMVLARTISQELYGDYKFILSIAGIIGGLSLSGLGSSLTQAVAKGSYGTIYESFKTQLIWGSLLSLASLCTSFYYFLNDHINFSIAFIIVSLTLPITNSFSMYGAFLSGMKDFKRSTLYWIITQLLNVLTVSIIAIFNPNIILLIAGYFISTLIISIIFYIKVIRLYKPDPKTSDSSMIKYGHHLSVMGFIGTIANQADKILLFHFIGSAPLAVYSFANAIPEQARSFFKNIFNIGFPKFAELEEINLRKSISDKIIRLTGIAVIIVIVYYFISPFIYQVFFPKYTESIFYSQIYMLGLITFPGISLFATYFQIIKDTKTLYKLNIIGNVATIIFGLILIPKLGILGAVIENGISWTFMLLVNLFFFIQRRNKVYSLVK